MKIFCSSLFIIGGWLLVDQIRHYDAVLGRWMCVDPLAEKYLNIGNYVYCVGNPVKLIDTDGKDIFLPGNKKNSRCICQDVIQIHWDLLRMVSR